MKTNVFNSTGGETVKIELEMTQAEFNELINENNKTLSSTENEDEKNVINDLELKGLKRKRYRITCKHLGPNGEQVSWIETQIQGNVCHFHVC